MNERERRLKALLTASAMAELVYARPTRPERCIHIGLFGQFCKSDPKKANHEPLMRPQTVFMSMYASKLELAS